MKGLGQAEQRELVAVAQDQFEQQLAVGLVVLGAGGVKTVR